MSPTDPPSNLCPAKIVVLDTRNGGSIVRSHEFPDSVVSGTRNFLNDIVLDYVDPDHVTGVRYAYISDTMGKFQYPHTGFEILYSGVYLMNSVHAMHA